MMAAGTLHLSESFPWQWRDPLAKRAAEVCLILMICLAVVVPPITGPKSELWLKIEQLLLPVAVTGYGWLLLAGRARLFRLNAMFLIALAYCACMAVSMWWGSIQLGQTIILRDYYEFPKAWLPVMFFTLAYEAELQEDSLRKLMKFFGVTALFICAYAWAQWAGFGFTYTLNTFYSSGMHDDVLISLRRVYSTFGNANLLGEFLTWSMAAFVLAALANVGKRAWNVGLAFGCLISLAMTGSRYGLLDGGLTLALIILLPSVSRREGRSRRNFLLALVAVFALSFGVVARSNQRTLERYQTLRNPMQADSLRGRLDRLWLDALDEFKKSPIIGRGPAKTIFTGIYTDSEYLDVLKWFGIVGFLVYILYFLFPLSLLVRGLPASQRAGPLLEAHLPATLMVLRLATVMAIMALVMNIGMSTFYNAPLQGFLWLWLGLGARCAKTVGDLPGGSREEWEGMQQRFTPAGLAIGVIPLLDLRKRR
jgi:hypothetical protein